MALLQEVGYQHGKTVFDVWTRSGVVDKMLRDRHQEEFHNTQSRSNVSQHLFFLHVSGCRGGAETDRLTVPGAHLSQRVLHRPG